MMEKQQSLTIKQKILVAIVFLVSALVTSEMAHLYIEKNGEYEYSIFKWIQVHQFSIVSAVGSVWLFNWKKIEFIKQTFFIKALLNWVLILAMTYILEIVSLIIILIFIH